MSAIRQPYLDAQTEHSLFEQATVIGQGLLRGAFLQIPQSIVESITTYKTVTAVGATLGSYAAVYRGFGLDFFSRFLYDLAIHRLTRPSLAIQERRIRIWTPFTDVIKTV